MAWVAPKTDHTAFDFENVTDWNRQKGNIEHVATVDLPTLAYFPVLATIPDATISTIPKVALINTLEENLTAISDCGVPLPAEWLESKDWTSGGKPDYQDINRWENNVLLVHTAVQNAITRFRPAGTFTAGQTDILPRRAT